MEGEEEADYSDHRDRKPKTTKKKGNKEEETIYHGYCNVRIHELAQPRRWCLLYTYKDYRHLLEADRAQAIKEKVQEMFGMTPEEAELYFNSIRKKKPRKVDLQMMKHQIRKERKEARRIALRIFHSILRKAMKYAHRHPPPLLVTPMLRIVSDHMLELLADLHNVPVPKRTNTDNLSLLLISIADWCAFFVSNIYYELEVEEREEEQRRKDEKFNKCSDTETTITTEVDKDEEQTKVIEYEDENQHEEAFQQQEE